MSLINPIRKVISSEILSEIILTYTSEYLGSRISHGQLRAYRHPCEATKKKQNVPGALAMLHLPPCIKFAVCAAFNLCHGASWGL